MLYPGPAKCETLRFCFYDPRLRKARCLSKCILRINAYFYGGMKGLNKDNDAIAKIVRRAFDGERHQALLYQGRRFDDGRLEPPYRRCIQERQINAQVPWEPRLCLLPVQRASKGGSSRQRYASPARVHSNARWVDLHARNIGHRVAEQSPDIKQIKLEAFDCARDAAACPRLLGTVHPKIRGIQRSLFRDSEETP